MPPPRYDPNFLFSTIKTSVKVECFFCKEVIDPTIHFEHFTTVLPGKNTLMATHVDCFEQLAWSMLKYVIKSIKRHKVEVQN